MGNKKRKSDSLKEDDDVAVTAVKAVEDSGKISSKRKVKKDKKQNTVGEEGVNDAPSTHALEVTAVDAADESGKSSPKKRVKKEKKRKNTDGEEVGANNAPSTPTLGSALNPMERKKHRKALAKGKRRTDFEGKEAKPLSQETSQSVAVAVLTPSVSSNGLPVFHLSVFNNLASADSSVREAAAEALVRELLEVQSAYEKMADKEAFEAGSRLEAEKDDGLDNCAPSVRYAVRRLIRGVSSSRECARQGFALALTVLVGTMPSIKIDSMLKLIVKSLEVSSGLKGQEARECHLGRLFAYGALSKSGRLLAEWNSSKSSPCIKEFTSHLVSHASMKRYLQEPAVAVLINLIEMLPVEAVLDHIVAAKGFLDWFEGDTGAGNPDALLLALKIREKISDDKVIFRRQLPHPYTPSGFFAASHLSSVVDCLKESTFCQPRVHGIWPVLVNLLLPDEVSLDSNSAADVLIKKHKKNRKISSSEEGLANNLKSFCEIVLEGALLLSSHERKHLAFDVVLLMLPRLPAPCIRTVFSYKFVQCLMDILSTKDSWLHKKAEHFVKELSEWVKNDDVRRVFVITALEKHSNGRFDHITKTKTIKELVAGFTSESGCLLFIQKLTNMFVDEDQYSDEPSDQSQSTDDNSELGSNEDKEANGSHPINSDLLKHWIIEALPNIPKHLTLDKDPKFQVQKEVMKFLAVQGLFSASLGTEVTSFELQEKFKWPKTSISVSLCRMCIEQLQMLFSIAQKGGGTLADANTAENDLGYYFMRFLGTIFNIPSVSLFRSLDSEDENAFKKLQAAETLLSREERKCEFTLDAIRIHSLRYLLIQLLLQLLLRPGEFHEAASELTICIGKDYNFRDLLDSTEEDDLENAPDTSSVTLDTLLSLLPQSSAPMRYAIEQVFRGMCVEISADGLFRMLRVIKKDLKPARHRNDASDEDDDDDDDLLEIEESDEIENAETVDDNDSQADDDESAPMVGVEATTVGSNGEASDDESDEDMDDEAMFRMDSLLAKIFQEKKNQAGGGDTAQSQLILFKLRVLSLLEIYLHENPESPKTILIYCNLVRALVNQQAMDSSDQLGQRIWGILQKTVKAKRYPRAKEELKLPALESLLEKSLKVASKPFKKKRSIDSISKKKQSSAQSRFKILKSLAQNSTHWVLKIVDGSGFSDTELEKVFLALENTIVAYFDSKKSQLKPEFLNEVFKRRPRVARHLFMFVLERCIEAKSDYRRVEALEIVLETLKSVVVESDDRDVIKRNLKPHLGQLSKLVGVLLTNMPEKQARRALVRKFCTRLFLIMQVNGMAKPFLKTMDAGTQSACESQLSDQFSALKSKAE